MIIPWTSFEQRENYLLCYWIKNEFIIAILSTAYKIFLFVCDRKLNTYLGLIKIEQVAWKDNMNGFLGYGASSPKI